MSNPFRRERTRPGEWVAETSIRLVASASIIVIFLIFVFVFREASSLFQSGETTSVSSQSTSTQNSEMVPESYGAESEESDVALTETGEPGAPGQFIYKPKNPAYPEIYNPDTGILPADIDVVSSESDS
ncbi:MAG: hypothetical protein H7X70_04995, partial [Candidatus Kapabacteria bacterium]|nr:hypothetical protein [Candidatus Kapabacteria bacterium]